MERNLRKNVDVFYAKSIKSAARINASKIVEKLIFDKDSDLGLLYKSDQVIDYIQLKDGDVELSEISKGGRFCLKSVNTEIWWDDLQSAKLAKARDSYRKGLDPYDVFIDIAKVNSEWEDELPWIEKVSGSKVLLHYSTFNVEGNNIWFQTLVVVRVKGQLRDKDGNLVNKTYYVARVMTSIKDNLQDVIYDHINRNRDFRHRMQYDSRYEHVIFYHYIRLSMMIGYRKKFTFGSTVYNTIFSKNGARYNRLYNWQEKYNGSLDDFKIDVLTKLFRMAQVIHGDSVQDLWHYFEICRVAEVIKRSDGTIDNDLISDIIKTKPWLEDEHIG